MGGQRAFADLRSAIRPSDRFTFFRTVPRGRGGFLKLKVAPQQNRAWVARAFTGVEDIVYLGLGVLSAGSSVALLVSGMISVGQNLIARSLAGNIVPLLD